MRLVLDTCVPESVYEEILDAGYDAQWTGIGTKIRETNRY